MIESLIMGYRYMMYSAQVSMGDDYDPEEEETAFEKWVGEHLGKKAEDALLACAAVLGGLLAILLFTVLPTLIVGGVNHFVTLGRWAKVVLEAVLKVGIFLTYMVGISKMKEIHRVFEYHGAEHKTIACYEAGDPLTVENVRKYTRFHPRCGTSFLILVVIVSVFLYSVLPWGSIGLRVLFKLLLLPLVMGISYELLKWCGRSDNLATRIIRQPGIWVQHLTVFEPDDSMIEVAIAAVTPVLPENPEEGNGNGRYDPAGRGAAVGSPSDGGRMPGCGLRRRRTFPAGDRAGCPAGGRAPDRSAGCSAGVPLPAPGGAGAAAVPVRSLELSGL